LSSDEVMCLLGTGEWVSGEEIASRLGVSRTAVWKRIEGLRTKGYKIDACTRRGYKLSTDQDLLDAGLIRSALKTKWVGKDLRCYGEVESTNETARSIASTTQNGTVVLAETQAKGRGRLSRSWSSPPGGVWMTLILKPEIPLAEAPRINMAVSVALAKAIQSLYGLRAGIKWPNDLLIEDRKICGILMEVSAEVDRLDYALVGIGINANVDVSVYPTEWLATSLSKELGRDVSRSELIQRILQKIEEAYGRMNSREIYDEWRRLSLTLGRHVRVASAAGELVGEAVELAEDGALLLKTEKGVKRVLAGDCIHLRADPWRDET
jgi:BirA family biotin operon repressor/biotin-[acetyl-CoA-carboxylase] ligase